MLNSIKNLAKKSPLESIDWKNPTSEKLVNGIISQYEKGAVIVTDPNMDQLIKDVISTYKASLEKGLSLIQRLDLIVGLKNLGNKVSKIQKSDSPYPQYLRTPEASIDISSDLVKYSKTRLPYLE